VAVKHEGGCHQPSAQIAVLSWVASDMDADNTYRIIDQPVDQDMRLKSSMKDFQQ
jgi:hypothetical protein